MLTPQLKVIRERLEQMSKRYNVDGTEPLLQELIQLDKLLTSIEAKQTKSLDEDRMIKSAFAMTSGPGEYCNCCGRKL
jgi:hypothetical protein